MQDAAESLMAISVTLSSVFRTVDGTLMFPTRTGTPPPGAANPTE